MADQGREDLKILGVPIGDPLWREAETLADIPGHLLRELEHFFTIYKDLEGKKTAVDGWQDAAEAFAAIEKARLAYPGPH
jgi:inorganic pyrophosphatase